MAQKMPSVDAWLDEAKRDPAFRRCGMYLVHNGTVRETPKAEVRLAEHGGVDAGERVARLEFGYDADLVRAATDAARAMPGIEYVRVWLNEGELEVGDDIMLVLIGGDIRPHVVDALQELVGTIKAECVREVERAS